MAKKMKAAVVREFGKPLVIEEVSIPEPGPDEIQIKMEACGVCHTDLHAAEGDWPIKPTPPFIPGHEGVGYVSGVGRNVTTVKEGDRAGIVWLYSAWTVRRLPRGARVLLHKSAVWRLHQERRLCGICGGRSEACRSSPVQRGIH